MLRNFIIFPALNARNGGLWAMLLLQKQFGIVPGVGRLIVIKKYMEDKSYKRPYNIKEIKKNYGDRAESLLKDPVHRWRAETGIELVHKEPTFDEQERIWKNWNRMSDEMKKESDKKSIELFGKDNMTHNEEIMQERR